MVFFDLIASFLIELFMMVVGEALVELGFHSLSEKLSSKIWSRVFVGALYVLAGFGLGALSLKFLPPMIFGSQSVPALNFIFAPIVAGFSLCVVNWLMNRGIDDRVGILQVAKFIYGFAFALAFTLTRTIFG